MTHSLASRAAIGALLSLLVLAGGAPTAAARPNPGDGDSAPGPMNCPLMRIDTQLIRCDNLTGAGVPTPLFIPELQLLASPGSR